MWTCVSVCVHSTIASARKAHHNSNLESRVAPVESRESCKTAPISRVVLEIASAMQPASPLLTALLAIAPNRNAATTTADATRSNAVKLSGGATQPNSDPMIQIINLRGGAQELNLDWRFFAAGGIAAAASHGYTTPIDVVKTKMQTDPTRYNGSLPVAFSKVVQVQGVQFLFQGLAPTVIGYGMEGALKFGSYELCKPLLEALLPSLDRTVRELIAACIAGAIASLVLCPAEDVRIRLVADPSYAPSSLAALKRLSRENGPFASVAGFPAMAAKQVPYTMGKQVGFDVASRLVRAASAYLLSSLAEDASQREWAARVAPVIAALPAAITAAILSHPGDMVLTEYYKSSGTTSVPAAVRGIIYRGGLGELFLGLKARLVHVVSIIWVQLVMYDKIKVLLGLPATGSH